MKETVEQPDSCPVRSLSIDGPTVNERRHEGARWV